jgi:hypothetical protein
MHLLFQVGGPTSPEAVAGDDEDVSAMTQAVQACGGQQGISKEIRPLFRGAVAGEHNAALLVALVDDVVKVFGSWGMHGFEIKTRVAVSRGWEWHVAWKEQSSIHEMVITLDNINVKRYY